MDTMGEQTAAYVLTELDAAILEVESRRWKYAGAKESAIRERFGISGTRYYRLLNHLIDRPEALAHDPVLVRRLQRLRDARRGIRSARPA